jgi:hypothetical protein
MLEQQKRAYIHYEEEEDEDEDYGMTVKPAPILEEPIPPDHAQRARA